MHNIVCSSWFIKFVLHITDKKLTCKIWINIQTNTHKLCTGLNPMRVFSFYICTPPPCPYFAQRAAEHSWCWHVYIVYWMDDRNILMISGMHRMLLVKFQLSVSSKDRCMTSALLTSVGPKPWKMFPPPPPSPRPATNQALHSKLCTFWRHLDNFNLGRQKHSMISHVDAPWVSLEFLQIA
jgi:hypothetical protein